MAGKVLLIEDETNIAEAIRFILSRDGWQVTVLSSGEQAEATVRAIGPDLIILDLMLPDRSGLDVLAALRADPATTGLPVLMLTAKGQGRDREAAERAGVDCFMTKPFANADMVAAVRALAAGPGRAAARA
ncbi:response regulator transcription factor [Neotabrizicola shimadae]|uniref:Response regulator n=1 Tax=Neotabrizicola shimadae TaxID=2807096 RepID=A0A8G0ZVC1_9RHOB|nr:response regulator [Neotabrizicola shimadae]QYZ70833.1 response regulator [Neotabrizicola shimadae]